jgi:O-antigen/teichoic acid export membrane protein
MSGPFPQRARRTIPGGRTRSLGNTAIAEFLPSSNSDDAVASEAEIAPVQPILTPPLTSSDPTTGAGRGRLMAPLLAIGGGNIAALLFGLVSGVIAARALGPAVRGEYVASQTLAGTAAVLLTLGVTQAVVTYRGADTRLVGPLVAQAVLSTLVGCCLFVALAVTGTQSWLSTGGIAGGVALTVGGVLGANSAGLVQRRGHMTGEFQRVRLIPQFVGLIVVILLWGLKIHSSNVWLLTVGLAILLPSAAIMFGLLGGRRGFEAAPMIRPPRELVLGALGAFASVVGSQVIYRLDSLLVALWMPTSKVAFYAVATSAGVACATVGQAVGMLTFSRLRTIGDPRIQRAVIQRSTLLALVVTGAVALPVAFAAPLLVQTVYGSAFTPAIDTTRVLTLAAIPLSADYLLIHALLSMRAARSVFRVQRFAGALTLVFLFLAIPTGRLVLVALVSLGIYSASALLLFLAMMRRTADAAPARNGPK